MYHACLPAADEIRKSFDLAVAGQLPLRKAPPKSTRGETQDFRQIVVVPYLKPREQKCHAGGTMESSILIVDDEHEIAEILSDLLSYRT